MNEPEETEAPPLPEEEDDLEEELEELIINKIKHPSDRQFFIMAGLAVLGLAVAGGAPFAPDLLKLFRKEAVQVNPSQVAVERANQTIDHLVTENDFLKGTIRELTQVLNHAPVGFEIMTSSNSSSPTWKRIK